MNADRRLAAVFLARHPREAARLVERVEAPAGARLLESCAGEVAAEVLQHVDPVRGGAILLDLPVERAAAVLRALPPTRAASALFPMDSAERARLLAAVPDDIAHALRAALDHPDDSAARLMDPAVLAVPVEIDAEEARRLVCRSSQRAHYYLYVVDADRRPVGVVNLRELLGAPATAPVSTLMRSPVVTLPGVATAAVISAHPAWRSLHAIPVVDEAGALVGVVRHETIERIRADERDAASSSGVGVAVTEALWTVTASLVDEVATALRRPDDDHD